MIYPKPTFLLFCCALLTSCLPAPRPQIPDPSAPCRVTRVVDGDTVDMICAEQAFRARLTGYDTPETYEPGCAAEAELGHRATQRLRQMVNAAADIEAEINGTDRYGRELVRLRLDTRDVARVMIAEGLAVSYSGGRRINWCDRLTHS